MAPRRATTTSKLSQRGSRAQARQREIIDAAAAVFSEKGYHGSSTRDIADRVGMQQGSLYYHFPSKDAALAEVCRVGVEGFVAGLETIIAGEQPAEAKIRAAFANHLQGLHDRRDYIRTFLFSRHNLPRDLRQEISRLSRLYESRLEALLISLQADGAVRNDLDCRLAVLGFLGMCNAAAASHRPDPKIPLDAYVESFATLFLSGVMLKI